MSENRILLSNVRNFPVLLDYLFYGWRDEIAIELLLTFPVYSVINKGRWLAFNGPVLVRGTAVHGEECQMESTVGGGGR